MFSATRHDFASRRPMGLQLVRRLRALHENLAATFAPALGSLLRTPGVTCVVSVDETTYGQFVGSLDTPACFYLLKADPWDRLMLDIDPALLHPMLDRLMGGRGENEPLPDRPLTEIELCLAARIVRLFLQECRTAWAGVVDLQLDILQAESNPGRLRILPSDEAVVVVGFQLRLGELHGRMRLCLPRRSIDPIADKLLPEGVLSSASLADPSLEVAVTLAATAITGRELSDLRVGDIIATEAEVGAPAVVSIAGTPAFRAKPGVFHGRKAVVILEEIDAPQSAVDET